MPEEAKGEGKGNEEKIEEGEVPSREEKEKYPEEEIPEGKMEPFEDSKEVTSTTSLQRQYIPEEATKFRDVISGKIEEVKKE